MDSNSKQKLDLTQLRSRMSEKPRTKAGQIRQAWPDIRALIDAGHSLKDIWRWLNEIGIEIGYARLSHYTGQLKRRDLSAARALCSGATPEPFSFSNDAIPPSVEDASTKTQKGDGAETELRSRNGDESSKLSTERGNFS